MLRQCLSPPLRFSVVLSLLLRSHPLPPLSRHRVHHMLRICLRHPLLCVRLPIVNQSHRCSCHSDQIPHLLRLHQHVSDAQHIQAVLHLLRVLLSGLLVANVSHSILLLHQLARLNLMPNEQQPTKVHCHRQHVVHAACHFRLLCPFVPSLVKNPRTGDNATIDQPLRDEAVVNPCGYPAAAALRPIGHKLRCRMQLT